MFSIFIHPSEPIRVRGTGQYSNWPSLLGSNWLCQISWTKKLMFSSHRIHEDPCDWYLYLQIYHININDSWWIYNRPMDPFFLGGLLTYKLWGIYNHGGINLGFYGCFPMVDHTCLGGCQCLPLFNAGWELRDILYCCLYEWVLLLMAEIRLFTGTWDVKSHVNNGGQLPINWLAGFLSSTVILIFTFRRNMSLSWCAKVSRVKLY